ncbi:hypothetical protein AMATHDRAFT_239 [Amanita thiersii Skay4041]|uniref:Proteasome maturation factor UMP1 n=1 Tax=Amanita thiersii Skay4041 TaxID=703135 RepID=A0A2A9NVV7_9AGAR|nr:hypothetical protein AMATHDRAFT_239 [Amanita thiersii Skay4041]
MHQYTIVPANPPLSISHNTSKNALGLHDSLQHGPSSLTSSVISHNPLRHRVENWESSQDSIRLNLKRDIYGMHAPMRLLMERKLVASTPHIPVLPRSNIHLDILMGRDESIEPADLFGGMETGPSLDIHKEMEKKLHL